jgi:hypothetical protein
MATRIIENLWKQEHSLREGITTHNQQEECLWKQKSNVYWLKKGKKTCDSSTKPPCKGKMTKKRHFLHNSQGTKLEGRDEIEQYITTYLTSFSQYLLRTGDNKLPTSLGTSPSYLWRRKTPSSCNI